MTSRVRVSVVIPHLNEPKDLRRCLQALEAQRNSAPPFEIVVADNGSTPLPLELLAAFPSIRMTVESIPGPGPARNAGVAASAGDIIAFVDADCLPQPGWISRIVDFLDNHPDVSFLGGSIGIATTDVERMTAVEAYEAVFSYRTRLFVERDHFAATGNMAVRRSAFLEVGPFEGIGTHEDKLWGHRAKHLGHKIAYVPEARVLTPACRDFAELKKRIDRHVAHCAGELPPGLGARIKWVLLGGAMLASPLATIPIIVRSEDVPDLSGKLRAFGCLVLVRTYRGWRMIQSLRGEAVDETLASWNKNMTPVKRSEG